MEIDHHVSELLYQYDCVVIPGFGGFVANYSPAKIHPTQHTFSPPSKNISFNKNLTNNDGLLANQIAGAEKITYSKANDVINSFVETCNNSLQKGKRVEIKNIGTFYYDAEHNIQFDPDNSVNYLSDSFGLINFQSPPIKRESIEKQLENKFQDRPPIASGLKKVKLKKYRSVLLALSLIFLMIWLPLKTNLFDDFSFNYSGLNPFDSSTPIPTRGVEEPTLNNSNSSPSTRVESAETLTEILPPAGEEETKVSLPRGGKRGAARYHVIGGCFKYLGNAKRLVRKLKKKGYDAQMVGLSKSGLYRVSYGGHTTRKNALKELKKVRAKHIQSAWLFVNKSKK